MAGSVNKVILVGNLGRDPEVKSMQDGRSLVNMSVATSENWRDRNSGERKERVEWNRVVAFGKLAEIISEYARKGSKIYLSGSLRTRKWEKDGQTHYTTEIVAKEMQLLDRKETGERNQNPIKKPEAGGFDDFGEDDIPFS